MINNTHATTFPLLNTLLAEHQVLAKKVFILGKKPQSLFKSLSIHKLNSKSMISGLELASEDLQRLNRWVFLFCKKALLHSRGQILTINHNLCNRSRNIP